MLNSPPFFWYVYLLLISKIDSPFFFASSKHYSIQMRCNLVMTFAVSQNELFLSSVKKRIDILAWWKSGMHTIQNEMYWFAFSLGWNVCCPWELFSSIHIILLLHFILGYLLWRIRQISCMFLPPFFSVIGKLHLNHPLTVAVVSWTNAHASLTWPPRSVRVGIFLATLTARYCFLCFIWLVTFSYP